MPRERSGRIQVYTANHSAESGRWIDPGDVCTITAVYTDGCVQVKYPSSSSSSGYRTAYANKDVFFASNGIISGAWSPSSNTDAYLYEDMANDFGDVYATDSCVVVGQSGSNYQVIYPISSGYKLGWVATRRPVPPPPNPIDPPKPIPGPVADHIFDGKGVVVMASERIDFGGGEYIDDGDVCILTEIDPNTGYCDVTYPSGGDDVFTSPKQKDKRIPINYFVEYQQGFLTQKVTTDETYQVCPKSDMQTHGRSWCLDPGDEFHTTARAANGATQVLYECTRGAHAGWWKLGWIDLPYYWLDLNGWLDGSESGDLGSHGAADVWVNGNKLVERARDFYSANGMFPRGSTYEISNIVASGGCSYNGVHSGSLSGTMKDNVRVYLDFTKDPATLVDLRIGARPSKLEYLEGENLNTAGLKVEAIYSDGSVTDVTAGCSISGYDGTPGVKTVLATYGGKSTAFTAVVRSKSPTSLTVTSRPNKTSYEVGDEVSLDGLRLKATYDNGTSGTVDDYEVLIDEELTSTAGTKTIYVSYDYNGIVVDTTFDITVSEKQDKPVTPTDGPTLSVVASDAVSSGDSFDVMLDLTNNAGIASLKVKVAFDSSLLELTKVTYTTNMGGMSQQLQKKTPPVTLNWFNGTENFVGDATFATLTFKAVGAKGSKAKIELTFNPDDVYDISETNVGLNVVNKTISIDGTGSSPDLSREGWVNLDGGAKGYAKNGRLVTGWFDLGASKYYFDGQGRMLTGWQDLKVSGKTMHYYFNPKSGNLVRGTWFEIEGEKYYFRPSGNLATGWATIDDNGTDKKYYFREDGSLVKDAWRDIDNGQGSVGHYYFRPSGSMATGWATIDGKQYFFRPSGNMATGWADVTNDNGVTAKHYFDAEGVMVTGWQQIGPNTYYFRPSGAMQTGAATIDGRACTFTDKGVLVS